ncbi:hypothetical protein ACBY01_05855 [Sphingomonas sp. ac-8]|uniref:hypothetical protein n=1 Tax=Sphingomonas sp. ac-8 TaxID=3242977 RepID=UPI003A7FD724
MTGVLLAAALGGCSGEPASDDRAAPAPVATALPAAMLGRWGEDAGCTRPLDIAADRIGDAKVDAIRSVGEGTVDVDTSAEVDGITTGRRYRLASARGERLAVTVDGTTTTRIRCP